LNKRTSEVREEMLLKAREHLRNLCQSVCGIAAGSMPWQDAMAAVYRAEENAPACVFAASAPGAPDPMPGDGLLHARITVGSQIWGHLWVAPGPHSGQHVRHSQQVIDTLAQHIALCIEHYRIEQFNVAGELAGGIVHDLNNILSGVMTNVELMRLAAKRNDDATELADAVMITVKRGAVLSDYLSALARTTFDSPGSVKINERIQQILKTVKKSLPANVNIKLELDSDLPAVTGDPKHLDHAVLSLCKNAIEKMHHGGSIIIRTLLGTIDENVEESRLTLKPGRYAVVQVAGTEARIIPERPTRISEPAFAPQYGGLNYGLSQWVVYSATEQCNGAAFLEPDPATGRRVSLYFPIFDQP